MSVIYTPPEPHRHDWPSGHTREGTIGRCACGRYARKVGSQLTAGVYYWRQLDWFDVALGRLTGRIPPVTTEEPTT